MPTRYCREDVMWIYSLLPDLLLAAIVVALFALMAAAPIVRQSDARNGARETGALLRLDTVPSGRGRQAVLSPNPHR
ncbi:MAG TPA: hypothetical protein VEU47_00180 [Candidatus Cybelea sp.]|nr:hypothetical protein [Candidatus Cybelea sp.]